MSKKAHDIRTKQKIAKKRNKKIFVMKTSDSQSELTLCVHRTLIFVSDSFDNINFFRIIIILAERVFRIFAPVFTPGQFIIYSFYFPLDTRENSHPEVVENCYKLNVHPNDARTKAKRKQK